MYPATRNAIVTGGLLALTAVTWFLSRPPAAELQRSTGTDDSDAGYYLKNATLLRTDAEGRIFYRVTAEQVQQTVSGDELLLQGLRIEYDPDFDVRWRLSATEGRTRRGDSVLVLGNGVQLFSDAVAAGPGTVLTTDSMRLDTASSTATTTDPIVLTHGRTIFSASGMTADLAGDRLELHSDVSARRAP